MEGLMENVDQWVAVLVAVLSVIGNVLLLLGKEKKAAQLVAVIQGVERGTERLSGPAAKLVKKAVEAESAAQGVKDSLASEVARLTKGSA